MLHIVVFLYVHRVASSTPIWWLVDGPRTVSHDFSASFCEINLNMTVYNSSEEEVSVRITTLDSTPTLSSAAPAASISGDEVGWHDLSYLSDTKGTTDTRAKSLSAESVAPFVWSGLSSTRINLGPLSSTQVPLQISVFSPGTFDLSNYSLHWNFVSSGDGSKVSSATCYGHPYHISVLRKE